MARCRKQQITVNLTDRCNLACKYCYSKNHSGKTIDINFAKRGISDYFALNQQNREIRFFGAGEPTLEIELMRSILNYARQNNEIKVELQTNGFFDNKTSLWLSKNINTIWISYDGTSNIQNVFRPCSNGGRSSDTVEDNVRYFASIRNVLTGVRVTASKHNDDKLLDAVKNILKLGIKYICIDPMFSPITNKITDIARSRDMMVFANSFLEAFDYAHSNGAFLTSILTTNFDEKVNIACMACTPAFHLTTDGFVSACDIAFTGNGHMDELIIGRYDSDVDAIVYFEDRIENLKRRNSENLKECEGCDILYNCAGGCLGEALNETGSIYGIRPDVCMAKRYLAKHIGLNVKPDPILHP